MDREVKVIIAGGIVYWLTVFLFLRFSEDILNITIGTPLFAVVTLVDFCIAPFMLGLIISLLLKDRNSWIYGVISYHVYFIIASLKDLIILVFIGNTYTFQEYPYSIMQSYLFVILPVCFFVILGGLAGHYIDKNRNDRRRERA